MTPTRAQKVSKFLKTLLAILFTAALAVVLFCEILFLRNIFLPRYPTLGTPRDYTLAFEEVDFVSGDGVQLKGWFIPKDPKAPVIIALHGLGANKSDILDLLVFFQNTGYNVFAFDFRGHGESKGNVTSFGYLEVRDVIGALDYLDSRKDIQNHIYGAFGVSMGGSVAIVAAAKDERIKAVCADTPYIDLKESILWHVEKFYHYPRFPFGFASVLLYQVHFRCNINEVSPLRKIDKLTPRAVMIINGEKDDRMLPEEAKRLYNAAKEPKSLWLIPGAGHMEGYYSAKGEYERRVAEFFKEWLK